MVKSIWGVVGAIGAILSAFVVLHTQFLLPSAIDKAATRWRAEFLEIMRDHESRPHRDTVSQREIDRVFNSLDSLATKDQLAVVMTRLSAMESRLDKIERN